MHAGNDANDQECAEHCDSTVDFYSRKTTHLVRTACRRPMDIETFEREFESGAVYPLRAWPVPNCAVFLSPVPENEYALEVGLPPF